MEVAVLSEPQQEAQVSTMALPEVVELLQARPTHVAAMLVPTPVVGVAAAAITTAPTAEVTEPAVSRWSDILCQET